MRNDDVKTYAEFQAALFSKNEINIERFIDYGFVAMIHCKASNTLILLSADLRND